MSDLPTASTAPAVDEPRSSSTASTPESRRSPPPLAYSLDDAARMLSVSKTTIKAMLRRGELRSVRIASVQRIPRAELERVTRLPPMPTEPPPPAPGAGDRRQRRRHRPRLAGGESMSPADVREAILRAGRERR